MIEGLPGVGFVASIAALHLISELNAKKFCEIRSPSFQAFSLTSRQGDFHYPINELYTCSTKSTESDLIILFGNSQANDSRSQYALCNQILDVVSSLGCEFVITIGGLKTNQVPREPHILCAATDKETLLSATKLGAGVMHGHIYGVAGLLIALARLRKMRGLCVLSETSGFFADVSAAKSALQFVSKLLSMKIDYSRLDKAAENNRGLLDSFAKSGPSERPSFAGPI
jgi:uncharacterized protein (TIGR00162 family)